MTTPIRRPSPLARIHELETRVQAALAKLEGVTPGLAPIVQQSHAELSYVQADIEQFRQGHADLHERCTRLETTVTHIERTVSAVTERVVALEAHTKIDKKK